MKSDQTLLSYYGATRMRITEVRSESVFGLRLHTLSLVSWGLETLQDSLGGPPHSIAIWFLMPLLIKFENHGGK